MRVSVIIFLMVAVMPGVTGQEFSVMFYNAENLFDTSDDTTRNDDEFLPRGSRRWTGTRYRNKIAGVSRVIAAAGEWELPPVIGLCEVENEKVVRDLAYSTLLSAGNYGIVHRESPDPRGIDLALLFRREMFRIEAVRSWVPETKEDSPWESRNLLYVKMTMGEDTLHVILCHFPSRRGGMLAAERLREEMAALVRMKTDSVVNASPGASVIVMGDFNVRPDDNIMTEIAGDGMLVNTAEGFSASGKGSYRYQGTWELIDQILVTTAMADGNGSFTTDPMSFRCVSLPFMLTTDPGYPGMKPYATYVGFRWAGGYSDHLPVMITVRRRMDTTGDPELSPEY
jgi:endonuclease/exonuclease/phosphatase family metal-dependent hydrolase